MIWLKVSPFQKRHVTDKSENHFDETFEKAINAKKSTQSASNENTDRMIETKKLVEAPSDSKIETDAIQKVC